MLFAVNLEEDLIDVEGIAIALMTSLQTPGVDSAKPDTPEAYPFSRDNNASLNQKVFDIQVAQVEAAVEPDSIADDIGRESVTFIGIHHEILPISAT